MSTYSAKITERAWAFWDEDLGNFLHVQGTDGRHEMALFQTKKAAEQWERQHSISGIELKQVFVDVSF